MQPSEAEALIFNALDIAPDEAEVHVHLAQYQASFRGDYAAAISNLKRADALKTRVSLFPDLTFLQLIMLDLDLSDRLSATAASIYLQRSEVQETTIPPDDSLNWIPRKDNFYNYIAERFIDKGEYVSAQKYLELSLLEEPRNRWALENRANMYYLSGDYERAIESYSEALKYVADRRGWALSGKAFAYQEIGQHLKSIETFKSAMQEGFPRKFGYYNIAATYSILGNKELALEYLSSAIEEDTIYRGRSKLDSSFIVLWLDVDFVELTASSPDDSR